MCALTQIHLKKKTQNKTSSHFQWSSVYLFTLHNEISELIVTMLSQERRRIKSRLNIILTRKNNNNLNWKRDAVANNNCQRICIKSRENQ